MAEPSNLRMDAYYFGFEPTGVREIDELLSTIACAGKAYHHTDCWTEGTPSYGDHCAGDSPVLWIQNAAIRAATALDRARAEGRADGMRRAADLVGSGLPSIRSQCSDYGRAFWDCREEILADLAETEGSADE